MKAKTCSKCGQQIQHITGTCKNCGHSNASEGLQSYSFGCSLFLIVILIVVALILFLM